MEKGIKRKRDAASPHCAFEEACSTHDTAAARKILDDWLVSGKDDKTRLCFERCYYEACWDLAEARRKSGGLHFLWRRARKIAGLVDMLGGHAAMANRPKVPNNLPEELWDKIAEMGGGESAMAKATEPVLKLYKGSIGGPLSVSPSGDLVASGNFNSIALWDVYTAKLVKTLEGDDHFASVCFSPSGHMIASGEARLLGKSRIKLWNVETGNEIRTLEGHRKSVLSLSFSPAGDILASGSWDRTIKLWRVETGELINTLDMHSDGVKSVSFHPSGDVLASGSSDKTIKLWRVKTGGLFKTLKGHSGSIRSVAFSPSGDVLASGSWDNTIKLWNAETGRIKTLDHYMVNSVSFSPSGDVLVSGSVDTTIKMWDVKTGELIKTLDDHVASVNSVRFFKKGDLASVGRSQIIIWSAP